jgi:putative FmdB family regulatory protein
MPLYDYKCGKCDHVTEDMYAPSDPGPLPQIACEICQSIAERYYGNHQFMAISDTSPMYGTYHPGFGEVVDSYGHKQQLLKKYNVEEASDLVGGSRCHMPDEYSPDGNHKFKPRAEPGNWLTEQELNDMGSS